MARTVNELHFHSAHKTLFTQGSSLPHIFPKTMDPLFALYKPNDKEFFALIPTG